jgi:hypothetical protein
MNTHFIGNFLPDSDVYSYYEKLAAANLCHQIDKKFNNQKNIVINLTWFGPQFQSESWLDLLELEKQNFEFDNVFLLALVDPPYLNSTEIQEIKNKVNALNLYCIGHFDNNFHFNFFAPILAKNFYSYNDQNLILSDCKHVFVNYNRKPKQHRVDFVKKLQKSKLDKHGIITLGKGPFNNAITIGETQDNYVGLASSDETFGVPMDYFTLHKFDVWKHTFLYVNAATEFNPINDLFIQQDVFKPLIGLRPFVINGVQKTYKWLRVNGFRTFNQYWSDIQIEKGDVHKTLIELLLWLSTKSKTELVEMYNDMLPDLFYNRERFFEFAEEQKHKMENIFQ